MRLAGTILFCIYVSALAGPTAGQEVEIDFFSRDGEIGWTNGVAGVIYSVEWCPQLSPTASWCRSWSELDYIPGTNGPVAVAVPVFYRVVCSSNLAFVPECAITVDGTNADWAAVDATALSPRGCSENDGPAGADVKTLRLARDGSTLFFLFEVWTNQVDVTGNVEYCLWFDNNRNGTLDGDSYDRQISVRYFPGQQAYAVSCQNMGDWWSESSVSVGANGKAAGAGSFLEGSIDFGALGIPQHHYLHSGTHSPTGPENYDRFPMQEVILDRE